MREHTFRNRRHPQVDTGCINERHPHPAGQESLDVTLAYLKRNDAESEEGRSAGTRQQQLPGAVCGFG
jgi:hypothetical protein